MFNWKKNNKKTENTTARKGNLGSRIAELFSRSGGESGRIL